MAHPASLFIVLTIEEAEAISERRDSDAGIRGLAKIRTAVAGTRAIKLPMAKAGSTPLLRAHDYRPRDPKVRPAKAPIGLPPATPPSPALDDYTPWRDEADGIYK
jgi:hypothetical protein